MHHLQRYAREFELDAEGNRESGKLSGRGGNQVDLCFKKLILVAE